MHTDGESQRKVLPQNSTKFTLEHRQCRNKAMASKNALEERVEQVCSYTNTYDNKATPPQVRGASE